MRRAKIVTTLGPATDKEGVLEQLIAAGANVVRINFSHGDPQDHKDRVDAVRAAAKKLNMSVGILGDLQGPKIRIARFKEGAVAITVGQEFVLDRSLERDAGTAEVVGIDYKELVDDCVPGDILLLDDGRVVLEVKYVEGDRIVTTVTLGTKLSNNKGINKLGGGLSADALTEKDMRDIKLAAELQVDFLAVSFPRCVEDMVLARKLAKEAGLDAKLVAKIERAELVEDRELLDGVIDASDVLMVARGDLGVEIGDAELMPFQKYLIRRSRQKNKVVITATQMMETMIENPMPTRAEVFDVANAVLDGTDAVMLSGETAVGAYPVQVVEQMSKIIIGAEKHPETRQSRHRLHQEFERVDETVALGAMYVANHLPTVKGIACLTESGGTPLIMSRITSNSVIYAFSRDERTQATMALYRGVVPVPMDTAVVGAENVNRHVVDELRARGVVSDGDHVVITKGDYANVMGGTNGLKIVSVDDVH